MRVPARSALGGSEEKRLGAQVIIDARSRSVRASLDAPCEGITIFAVDLISDTWDDFHYFADQARLFEQTGDLQRRNRYVRVATASLFSHLDGVVSETFDLMRKENSFKPYLPKNPDFCSLKAKARAIQDYLHQTHELSLPTLNLELKLLRDIVNHPSVTKRGSQGSVDTILLDGADVYGIAVDDLEAAARNIDQWLNAICAAVPYERFRDTKQLVDDFVQALGSNPTSVRNF